VKNPTPRTAADARRELDEAQADRAAAQARIEEMKRDGNADTAAVDELLRLNAKCELLAGRIRHLSEELPRLERVEIEAEIARLSGLAKTERAAADAAAEALAKKAVALLVPEADSHPAWSYAYCERRSHELLLFAKEHPAARCHTDTANDAKAEADRLRLRLAN